MRAASALGGAVKEGDGAAANGKAQVDIKRMAADQRDKVKSLQKHRLVPKRTRWAGQTWIFMPQSGSPRLLQRTDLGGSGVSLGRFARPWNQGRPCRCISGRHCEKTGPAISGRGRRLRRRP